MPSGLVRVVEQTRTVTENIVNPLALALVEETVAEEGDTFTRSYDGVTRTWTVKSPEGRTARTTVDEQSRPTKGEATGVLPVAMTYDARGRLAGTTQGERALTYGYDAATGYLASIADATSRKTLYQRDAAARPTTVTGPDGAKLSMSFDPHDNVTSVTPPGKSSHAFVYTPDDLEASYTPPKSPATTRIPVDEPRASPRARIVLSGRFFVEAAARQRGAVHVRTARACGWASRRKGGRSQVRRASHPRTMDLS